jgi:hypothetical protein
MRYIPEQNPIKKLVVIKEMVETSRQTDQIYFVSVGRVRD